MDYIAYLHKDKKSDFGVSFPDFPGCISVGKTLDEARRLAVEALEMHIAGMIEDGEELPEPAVLDDLTKDPVLKGAVAFLVHVEPPTDRAARIHIIVREKQIAQIDRRAKEVGITRSAFMVQSSLRASGKDSRRPAR